MELGREKTVEQLIARLKEVQNAGGPLKVAGNWGSFAHLLTAHIAKQINRPILYICPHIDDADKTFDDLHAFGADKINPLPAWEGTEDLADATDEIRSERLRIVSYLSSLSGDNFIIPTSIQALCQPVPKPQKLAESALSLSVDTGKAPEDVIEWLVDNGFERVDRIDLPGQFARRGGIIDIYAPLLRKTNLQDNINPALSNAGGEAIRLEFFGDNIESIRQINLDTNLSTQQLKNISVMSVLCGTGEKDKELFVNILPENTIIILEEPQTIEEVAKVFLHRVENPEMLYSWEDIYNSLKKFTRLHINRFAVTEPDECFNIDIKSIQSFQHKSVSLWAGHKEALEQLVNQAKHGKKVYLYCEALAEIKRLKEIIEQTSEKVPENLKLLQGFIHQGFIITSLDTIIISHHELFGQYALRRRQRPIRPSITIDSLSDLNAGDYVVHASYGIGKFLGIKTIKQKQGTGEYLTIQYADGVKIQASTANIALVQKYIGTSPKRPKLSKIGSKKWQKQKQKVIQSVANLADELLAVQAQRRTTGGIALGDDSNWQREFEESFIYQETADQTIAAEQIKADMKLPVAMDRLLCGDVGYGKTELAMRAAFKAVEASKQVAVLVPTTVLSVQHERTFNERFADFPICIEILNRFKTPKQAADIIARTKEGTVDILIGTHRLLSGDVAFKDLGLLIIDEEQKFGVEHKEKLKKLRVNVDILTMTATPIPRTLHMSLLGLRDISSLATPPLDRRSVVTSVTAYNKDLIRKSIIRELNRQGQVFFLHNRVKTIDKKAWEIKKLLEDTEAQISIAHGQMSKKQLEKAMIDLVTGKTDVLVCTTIIESGLDIPNANTIFIDNADRFGLAELHQLRGRVGRYKNRAYAYMLLPDNRSITPIAAKRLKAIEEYSHLGAGFRIALRDLEIRGAGNILGPEQSGHIQLVGYQMYCELLADAVRKLKGQPAETKPVANIELGFAAYIPKNYIPSDRHRMEAYRKFAVAKTPEDVLQLESELADVYGPIPQDIKIILELRRLRIAAGKRGIKSITTSGQKLIFSFTSNAAAKEKTIFENVKGRLTVTDPKTIFLRLEKNYFEPNTLITVLRKILDARS
jgi:transcription-repair coupling factor (superfamily II helicase)